MRTDRLGLLLVLATALTRADTPAPKKTATIRVEATRGEIVPRSQGGGFQRSFRFRATPGANNHWIRQALEVRGTVKDKRGKNKAVHLDVIEYYRVNRSGRTIQFDSHYSVFRAHCAGSLTLRSTLTYGVLTPKKVGDTIMGKSFILRSCLDAEGNHVTMRTRKGRIIPAEKAERVEFHRQRGSMPTHYEYRVEWDACPGSGPRTQPNGKMAAGVWWIDVPKSKGDKKRLTKARARRRPIPRIKKRS